MYISADEIEKKFPGLVSAIARNNLVIFVGAGFSMMAGYPSWSKLMAPLALQIDMPTTESPIDIAQAYVNASPQGRHLMVRHIDDQLQKIGRKYTIAHRFLKELPVKHIITTNYDTLIEDIFRVHPEKEINTVISNSDVPYMLDNQNSILFKVNGCITRKDTIVATLADFQDYRKTRSSICDQIKALYASHTVLYLLTSFSEPVYNEIQLQTLKELGVYNSPGYILTLGASHHKEQELKRHGLDPINLGLDKEASVQEIDESVNKFLEELVHLSKKHTVAGQELGYRKASHFDDLLTSRLGTGLSLVVHDDEVDYCHQYSSIQRIDQLDYETGDFYSIRRLKGVNNSNGLSSSIPYTECSENRLCFDQTEVLAFDYKTRKSLDVRPFKRRDQVSVSHPFRIFFDAALAPGEEFDIVFSIRLPGELQTLSAHSKVPDEIMSLSLARLKNEVKSIDFRVCLNFEPSQFEAEYHSSSGEITTCTAASIKLQKYLHTEWYEDKLGVDWSSSPHCISMMVNNPSSKLYIIKYKG